MCETAVQSNGAVELEIGTLTKQDLKAFKQAERVSFFSQGDYKQRWDCSAITSSIRLTKEVRNHGPFDEREKDYDIAVRCAITDYEDDEALKATTWGKVACFEMEYCGSPTWRLLVAFLKVGDVLSLQKEIATLVGKAVRIELRRGRNTKTSASEKL